MRREALVNKKLRAILEQIRERSQSVGNFGPGRRNTFARLFVDVLANRALGFSSLSVRGSGIFGGTRTFAGELFELQRDALAPGFARHAPI